MFLPIKVSPLNFEIYWKYILSLGCILFLFRCSLILSSMGTDHNYEMFQHLPGKSKISGWERPWTKKLGRPPFTDPLDFYVSISGVWFECFVRRKSKWMDLFSGKGTIFQMFFSYWHHIGSKVISPISFAISANFFCVKEHFQKKSHTHTKRTLLTPPCKFSNKQSKKDDSLEDNCRHILLPAGVETLGSQRMRKSWNLLLPGGVVRRIGNFGSPPCWLQVDKAT